MKTKNPHMYFWMLWEKLLPRGEKPAGLTAKRKTENGPESRRAIVLPGGGAERIWSSWATTKMQNKIQDYAMSAGTQDQAPVPHLAEPFTLETVQHHLYRSVGGSFPAAGGLLEDGSASCAHPQHHRGASSFSSVSRPHWSLWMSNHHSAGRRAGGVEDGVPQWQGVRVSMYSYLLNPCSAF